MLAQVLSNDFKIHPLDGDRESEDPANLVLIYDRDSLKLDAPSGPQMSKSENCYLLKVQGRTWAAIERETGVDRSNAWKLAKKYAQNNNLKWPL